MFKLSLLIGKLIKFIGSFSGRSTHLPGKIVLRICPNFLGKLNFSGKIIAVTGSNGKTTTTNLIAHILTQAGYHVVHNKEGSNLTAGVISTLLSATTFSGKVSADFVVLEVDERYSRFIFQNFSPHIYVITNLVRDQVVRNGHPDIIFDKINQSIKDTTTLVLNANDPISAMLGRNANPKVYYSMNQTSLSTITSEYITNDSKVCPICFSPLHYHFYHYNHIGNFYCNTCSFTSPNSDFIASDIDFDHQNFNINNINISVNFMPAYHILNTTAAFATCKTLGLLDTAIIAGIESFIVAKERYDTFIIDNRKATLVLTKQNSVSLDQSISFALSSTAKEKTIVLMVNNVFYTENKDISWLYDVTFERLLGHVGHIICLGTRAYDIAVRLSLCGFTEENILVDTDINSIHTLLQKTSGEIFILAASAFGSDDGILEVLS